MRTAAESLAAMNEPHYAWSRLVVLTLVALSLISGCKKKSVESPPPHAEPTSNAVAPSSLTRTTELATATPSPAGTPLRPAGPKIRHPERGIVGEPQPPDALRERLRQEFDGINRNDRKFFETLRRLWSEFTLPEFDRSLQ